MFTKKHFEVIADILNSVTADNWLEENTCANIVDKFIAYFAQHEPNFKQDEFLKRCYK